MKHVLHKDLQKDNNRMIIPIPAINQHNDTFINTVSSSSKAYREPSYVGKTSRYNPTDVESLEVTVVNPSVFY